jgi:hypothetical protein
MKIETTSLGIELDYLIDLISFDGKRSKGRH